MQSAPTSYPTVTDKESQMNGRANGHCAKNAVATEQKLNDSWRHLGVPFHANFRFILVPRALLDFVAG